MVLRGELADGNGPVEGADQWRAQIRYWELPVRKQEPGLLRRRAGGGRGLRRRPRAARRACAAQLPGQRGAAFSWLSGLQRPVFRGLRYRAARFLQYRYDASD